MEGRGVDTLRETLATSVEGTLANLLLDAEKLVVLGSALRAAGGTSLAVSARAYDKEELTLISPVRRPTERSAMKVDSVSPERCEVMTAQPFDCES